MSKRKERIQELKKITKRLQKEYASDPNIQNVGWGMAKRKGKIIPQLTVIFYVKEKYKNAKQIENAGSTQIPKEIDGVYTDVRVAKQYVKQSAGSRNDKIYDPLVGGVSSANLEHLARTFFWYEGGGGTLGILCRDEDGNAMALSNWHVWADDGAEKGDKIIQPGSPVGATYAESITKVFGCGPLLSTVIEGRTPSGLSGGLYGGAAAAGILAAATDHKDPIRRGQEATSIQQGTFTHEETLELEFNYPRTIPWVGQPFPTDVNWHYNRQTNTGDEVVEVNETQYNPQILLGIAVAPNRADYEQGETIDISASIWDYQHRPSDGYHLVANMVPLSNPDYVYRMVLHPSTCRPINLAPKYKINHYQDANPVTKVEDTICATFGNYPASKVFGNKENVGPISVYNVSDESLQMVDWSSLGNALLIPSQGLKLKHPPANRLQVTVAQYTNRPVEVRAYNNFGVLVAQESAPNQQDTLHQLTLEGNLITTVEIDGGGGEGLLFEYCFDYNEELTETTNIPQHLHEAFTSIDVPYSSDAVGNEVIVVANRHCFRGISKIPQDAPTGRYIIYLSVSNVNQALPNTPPLDAVKIIGGQEMGYQSQALLCGFMLLGDHVFDIF